MASLAALDLLERKGKHDASMPFIERLGIRNVHITCSGRRKRAHGHAVQDAVLRMYEQKKTAI